MSGLPLFLARTACGKGPKVPARKGARTLHISGLGEGHFVAITGIPELEVHFYTNGVHHFIVPEGLVMQAELVGEGCSNAYVWLEE